VITPVDAGFTIRVDLLTNNEFVLSFGGWHEDMDSMDECWNLIEKALRGRIRLIEKRLGGKPWSYIVLVLAKNGRWQELGGMSYVLIKWNWLKETISTHQYDAHQVNGECNMTSTQE
jgi:hypothetical protein